MNRFIEAESLSRGPTTATCGPTNTALVIIDMQTDFCGNGGYVDKMGYDLSLTRAPIEPISSVLAADARKGLSRSSTRAKGIARICPICRPTSAGAAARGSARASATPARAARILVRGEPGWEIIAELAPLPGEIDHRQAGQGLVLRDGSRADPAHARHRAISC